jgi:predicted ester cyclase
MGNGAILPFVADPDDPADIAAEGQNQLTIRDYYARLYGDKDLDALASFVSPGITIHRDGQVQRGIAALRTQIIATLANFPDLQVSLQEVVAAKDTVAYHLTVTYTNADGEPVSVEGIGMSRLSNGLVAESWVTYREPQTVT